VSSFFSHVFCLYALGDPRDLHSFPTRRSSDLMEGGWELLQFSNAQEVEANVWQLSSLLRAQLGTNDVMMRGHPAGATFVLVNGRSEEHTSEIQSRENLVCRLLLEKKKQ